MKKIVILLSALLIVQFAFSQAPIQVEKSGEGNPILFLPGFTTPGSVWNETIEHLNGTFESHTVSYAGFNGLASIGTPWYAPIKDHLIAYVKEEELTNLTVVGHSMGGNLATDLAAALGDNVTGLILVDAIPCMRELMMPGVPASTLQYDSPYNNQMLGMSDDAFKNTALMMARNMTNQEDKVEMIAGWSMEADRKTYVYGYTDLLKLDLRPALENIQTHTLILGATFPTREMSQQTFEKQYENLSNKTISLADNSKHFIMFDQPEWLYSQINNYLAKNAQ
ncbi:Pimeloyl-ACP methyl ester carboxylesterase [Ekhidna lutea]|uniref:Pimeloyl-ACP methyl ester carboxylesterase n=1 Tax=Ekhidna lutea TaxID=447679 RepID=A0A239LDV9_EKHLU|nr:alpha/beta hydrolase [Ekhidna lutea]SNT28122.1 Pimeloyl-ACP methyl ester carboxylesterase [Ekhidna lutea]